MGRNARTVGERIEQLLNGLQSGPGKETAEELVRLLVEMYGEGLARVVSVLREHNPDLLAGLADDDLVESLLLLHDLHPLDVDTRIQNALDKVRPYLGSHAGGVQYLGVDEEGVVRLRLEGSCDGCPSSILTVKMAIEGAIENAAPEVTGVEVEGVVAEPKPAAAKLLQVGMGPPPGFHAPEPVGGAEWSQLPELGPPTRRPTSLMVEGMQVLVCSVRGTLYAYRDACASCGSSFSSSTLDSQVLTCSSCGARFDVKLAGKCVDNGMHLDPLPLLSDSQGVRVAIPKAVPS